MKSLFKTFWINLFLFLSKINFKKGIPVLIYHRVLDNNSDKRIAFVPESVFRNQMRLLKKWGYQTVDAETLTNFIAGKAKISTKSVVISFDDGFSDNLNAIKIAKEYDFSCVLFVATSFIGKSYSHIPYYGNRSLNLKETKLPEQKLVYLNVDQLKELKSMGTDILPHTAHHVCLPKSSYQEQICEIQESFIQLEKILGPIYKSFSYPYGMHNEETIAILKNLGFKSAFEVSDGLNHYNENNSFKIRRHNVGNTESKSYFKLLLTSEYKYYRKMAKIFGSIKSQE